MRELRPGDPDAIAEVESVIQRARTEWLAEPNVVALGVAIKVIGGVAQIDTLAIRFFVAEKLVREEVRERGWREIPDQIEDVPTDVSQVLQRPTQLLAQRSRRFDPLIGGIAIGNVNVNFVGTLGGVVFHNDDGRAVGLTNEHVLVFTDLGAPGDPVDQPRDGSGVVIGITEADCCPGGQLTVRDIPNPVRDTALAIAAAAAIAAALGDEIDPVRRGQEATLVVAGERTFDERVHVSVRYPDFPLPGTPYRVEADWTYQRRTDVTTHVHRVREVRQNPHVLVDQWLITDGRTYSPGTTVSFLAGVRGTDADGRCPPLHLVVHAVDPSGSRALRTVLRAVRPFDHTLVDRLFPDRNVLETCLTFERYRIGHRLGRELSNRRFRFRSLGRGSLSILDVVPAGGDGVGELGVVAGGVEVLLPFPVDDVTAEVATEDGSAVTLRGLDEHGTAVTVTAQGPSATTFALTIGGTGLVRLVLEGEGRAVLVRLCVKRPINDDTCLYWGQRRLSPVEATGRWTTFLLGQTVNDVAAGVAALDAAPTIGGLGITDNMVAGDPTRSIAYGSACPIDAVANGEFAVMP